MQPGTLSPALTGAEGIGRARRDPGGTAHQGIVDLTQDNGPGAECAAFHVKHCGARRAGHRDFSGPKEPRKHVLVLGHAGHPVGSQGQIGNSTGE